MKSARSHAVIQRAILKGVANKIERQEAVRSRYTSVASVLSLLGILLLIVSAPVLLKFVWEVIRGL